jgi:hypothetical protein
VNVHTKTRLDSNKVSEPIKGLKHYIFMHGGSIKHRLGQQLYLGQTLFWPVPSFIIPHREDWIFVKFQHFSTYPKL